MTVQSIYESSLMSIYKILGDILTRSEINQLLKQCNIEVITSLASKKINYFKLSV